MLKSAAHKAGERLRAVALMYHDVVGRGDHEASGFPSADAALYKLEHDLFDQHLRALTSACGRPITATDLCEAQGGVPSARGLMPWLITFDDGGASAYTHIADRLEALGWRGHFFIATDYIGEQGFMSGAQIRELRRRGHVIGAHSCSHPLRMAQCGWNDLLREWRVSTDVLSELLDEKVSVASVPGGQFSRQVAEAAGLAGIKTLFTSEPRVSSQMIAGCLVLGRYAVQRRMRPETAAALASGRLVPRLKQRLWWDAKKGIKALGGESYLKLRAALLSRAESG